MKKKEFRVKIPVGYQIDEEKSTFEKIVFKPVADAIGYNDVVKAVDKEHVVISNDDDGVMLNITIKPSGFTRGGKNEYVRKMFRVLANYQLLNIAKYYNGDWKPDFEKGEFCFYIFENKCGSQKHPKDFRVAVAAPSICDCGAVYFRTRADAEAVIDNPNFRQILDDYFS